MLTIIPIILYLVLILFIAWKVNNLETNKNNFLENYFIGNRDLGGFVLAMTIIATYIGASSFIGGPGLAYKFGLGWVLLACIQIPTAFLTLGILGKRIAIISRKINAITIIDILKVRYNSDFLVILSSVIMLIFFVGMMVANFVGGARIFESITNFSYPVSLTIFSVVIIFYTTIGGFKAVAFTDAIQGCIMLIASLILFFTILNDGGGMENIMMKIALQNPNFLTPTSGGEIEKNFLLSFWILVGIAVLGLPATTVRCMSFKDSKSLHKAIIWGTVIVGFLILMMHLIGVMGIAIIPDIEIVDKVVPTLALSKLHPILAGVFIGGPLAAIMSTIDSFLILTSATIVKNIYITYFNRDLNENKMRFISLFTSLAIGLIVFALALRPPNFLVWINLFALAGQEISFFCPFVIGLYWKGANSTGAILSMVSGVILFFIFSIFKIKIYGTHEIVPIIIITTLIFIIGSYFGKRPTQKILSIFFDF